MDEHRTVLPSLPVHPGVPKSDGPHRLHVSGLVKVAMDLDKEQLSRLPQTELSEDFECREGWTVPSQTWRGVLVADIVTLAGVDDEALCVEFAADEFKFTVPIEVARTAIVALALNGEPLPVEHGGPARLVLPGADCFTSVKWLDHIELRDQPGPNTAQDIALRRLGR